MDYLCFIVLPLNEQSVLNMLEKASLICFLSVAMHFCCFLLNSSVNVYFASLASKGDMKV